MAGLSKLLQLLVKKMQSGRKSTGDLDTDFPKLDQSAGRDPFGDLASEFDIPPSKPVLDQGQIPPKDRFVETGDIEIEPDFNPLQDRARIRQRDIDNRSEEANVNIRERVTQELVPGELSPQEFAEDYDSLLKVIIEEELLKMKLPRKLR